MLATSGRGSGNSYLIAAVEKRVIGNTPNAAAGPGTNAQRLSSGILLGREAHEPTFSRNGKELWVALRGEDRIAIRSTFMRGNRQTTARQAQYSPDLRDDARQITPLSVFTFN